MNYLQLRFLTLALSLKLVFATTLAADPSWQYINPYPVPGNVVSIDFTDNERGWIVTEAGLIMKTEDGGNTWEAIDLDIISRGPFIIDFYDDENGWISGGNDIEDPWLCDIYFTSDGGENWDVWQVGDLREPCNITCIQSGGSNDGWLGGSVSISGTITPAVFRYVNEDSWLQVELPEGENHPLEDINFISRDIGWAVSKVGYLAKTVNGGRDWSQIDTEFDEDLFSVSFSGPLVGWIAGGSIGEGYLAKTVNAGLEWSVQETPAGNYIQKTAARGINEAFAIVEKGDEYATVISTSNGTDWNIISEVEHYNLNDISIASDDVWAAGTAGYLAAYQEAVWQEKSSRSILDDVNDVMFLNQRFGWCAGDNGELIWTDSYGFEWNKLNSGVNTDLNSVHFKNGGVGWICGEWSNEYRSEDGGNSWDRVDISDFDIIEMTFKGAIGYAASTKSIAITEDGGDEWEEIELIDNFNTEILDMSVASRSTVYLATGESLLKSSNNGEDWETIEQRTFSVSFVDRDYGWVLDMGMGGGAIVYRSSNGGETWFEVSELPDAFPLGLEFIDRLNGYLWDSSGKIYSSEDGGNNWELTDLRYSGIINDIETLSSDEIWLVGNGGTIAHYGEVLRSTEMDLINIIENAMSLSVYPNPCNGFLTIRLKGNPAQLFQLQIFDSRGRFVSRNTPNNYFRAGDLLTISIDDLPTGTYLINVNSAMNSYTTRVNLLK